MHSFTAKTKTSIYIALYLSQDKHTLYYISGQITFTTTNRKQKNNVLNCYDGSSLDRRTLDQTLQKNATQSFKKDNTFLNYYRIYFVIRAKKKTQNIYAIIIIMRKRCDSTAFGEVCGSFQYLSVSQPKRVEGNNENYETEKISREIEKHAKISDLQALYVEFDRVQENCTCLVFLDCRTVFPYPNISPLYTSSWWCHVQNFRKIVD